MTARLSPGALIILAIAILSTVVVLAWGVPGRQGMTLWTFATNHAEMYVPVAEEWNARQGDPGREVHILSLSGEALEQRLLPGFRAGTPLADLVEIGTVICAKCFNGPVNDVGFVDLTDRIEEEGIGERLNEPSLGPWTTRGRVFGLPHDVHPVLLAYRADILEDQHGIDMGEIETWEDFVRVLGPLVEDTDGDGYVDHYLLNMWETNGDLIEVLILQAGGQYLNEAGELTVASEINARVISTIVTWTAGPNRIAANAPEFDNAGHQMRIEGYVLCSLMSDWLAGVWQQQLPQLAGKVKLMPLPAWEPAGRRTSVWGGTMLGIPKATEDFEGAWEYAKELYLSLDLAKELYERAAIVSPVKEYWEEAFYQEPNEYFSGQANGALFLEQAPMVPRRTASPYNELAKTKVINATVALKLYAQEEEKYTVEELLPEAKRLLEEVELEVGRQMERNLFLKRDEEEGS
ncbi:MAG: extracellular solute-binding protein [Verrucomicrobiota bacterium]